MTEREEKARDWLNRNYGIALEIQAIQRRLERMNSDLEKMTRPLKVKEVVEANNPGNAQEDRLADYIDLSADLSKRLTCLMRKDGETMKVIENLTSPTLRAVLIERYINRLSWKKMTEVLHYEQSRLFDYHRQALDSVLPFIPEEVKRNNGT